MRGIERADGRVKVTCLYVIEMRDVCSGEGDGGAVAIGGTVRKAEVDRVNASASEGV